MAPASQPARSGGTLEVTVTGQISADGLGYPAGKVCWGVSRLRPAVDHRLAPQGQGAGSDGPDGIAAGGGGYGGPGGQGFDYASNSTGGSGGVPYGGYQLPNLASPPASRFALIRRGALSSGPAAADSVATLRTAAALVEA